MKALCHVVQQWKEHIYKKRRDVEHSYKEKYQSRRKIFCHRNSIRRITLRCTSAYTVQRRLSDHRFSDNTGHPIFFVWPAKILSIPCMLPWIIRIVTTDYPTTQVIRHFLPVQTCFTMDYPIFFVKARKSREKKNIY